MSGVLAEFASEAELLRAVSRLRAQRLDTETYSPVPLSDSPGNSPLPTWVLAAGIVGAAAAFGIQSFAVMVSYPQDIGGRPPFSWPSFVPIAFEVGALCATLCAFFGFLAINRLPKLYDPIDECESTRRSFTDAWLVAVHTTDSTALLLARKIFDELGARRIEDIPS